MKTIDIGALRPKWRGAYDKYATYSPNDILRFNGAIYRCIQESREIEPINGLYFEPLTLGSDTLTAKGQVLTFDGQVQVPVQAGNNGEYLKMVNGMPTWALQEGRAGANCKALCKGTPVNSIKTSAFLMDDGSIRCCGEGTHCVNGSGTADAVYLPQAVAIDPDNPPRTPFNAVYANHYAFYATTEDGDVYSWGHNDFGQLGLGHTADTPVATLISFFRDNDVKIKEVITPYEGYSQYCQTYFLTFTGELYAVGHNGHGQLGDGTTTNKSIPVRCGFLTGIKKVAVSITYYTGVLALEENGDVWAWGYNGQGALGFGDTTNRTSPNKISSVSDVKDILMVAGHNSGSTGIHSVSILVANSGKVYTAGSNFNGQLGVGDTTNRTGFVQMATDIIQKKVFAGGGCYLGIAFVDDNDNLFVCGSNDRGQLGLGDTTYRTTLTQVVAPFEGGVEKVGFFGSHNDGFTIVLDKAGKLWGAGYNGQGQIARGNSFVAVNAGFYPLAFSHPHLDLKIVDFYTCGLSGETSLFALTEDGRVMACGYNNLGQLGTQSANLHRAGTLETVLF